MDLTNENVKLNEFNLPPEDYNSTGQVRVLRKRMLKKLLKYEYKAIFSWLWLAFGVLAGVTALTVCSLLFYTDDTPLVSLIIPILLYVYAVVGVTLTPIIIASVRYNKNFFKSQGYLTFSVPASVEEHLFAKHVSAISAFFLAILVALISVAVVLFVAILTFGFGEGGGVAIENQTDFLSVIESLFSAILSPIAIVCAGGALDCWGKKFRKKRQIFFRVLIAYFVITILETVILTLDMQGVFAFFYTPVGAHLSSWFGIILLVGIIVLSVWYEIRTLKNNLNLK